MPLAVVDDPAEGIADDLTLLEIPRVGGGGFQQLVDLSVDGLMPPASSARIGDAEAVHAVHIEPPQTGFGVFEFGVPLDLLRLNNVVVTGPATPRTRYLGDVSAQGGDACFAAGSGLVRFSDCEEVMELRIAGETLAVLAPRSLGVGVVGQLTSRGIGFRSLTEGLHTEGAMGKAMLTIMAAFAQLERDTMIERTRAGLAAAAANGRKGGRPRKVDDADAAKARSLRDKGITATDIAKMLGVSRATVYRYLSECASLPV
jgi:Helix-turn-helix domain of resolvase/Resolvase, N terminal domain